MDHDASYLESDASRKVLFPIFGLMGGLLLGFLRAWVRGDDELGTTFLILVGGFVGSVLGMGIVLATAYPFGKTHLRSLKGLCGLVFLASGVCWFMMTMLRDLLANSLR